MFKFGMKSDTIQFWLLVMTGLGILSGFAGYVDARYFKASRGEKLAWEVHALYLTIPESQRAQIEKERDKFELEQFDR